MTSTLPKGILVQQLPCQQQPSIKEILIGTTSSGISYQLRDIYSICRCCWIVATQKWKVHNGQGMKQPYLYLWYPLFQAQWDRCDHGVPATRYLVLCVCFVDRCLSFCTFSFGHCVVCYSSNSSCTTHLQTWDYFFLFIHC